MSESNGTILNLAAALLRAQRKIDGVSKDATNPHFKSQYADLTAVIEAVIPALNEEGIVVLQAPTPAPYEGHLALTTTLIHAESGESASSTAVVPLPKADPQGYGSALTYTRRYTLGSLVGLKFKDDDGNAASNARPAPVQRSARPEPIEGSEPAKPRGLFGKKAAPVEEAKPEPAKPEPAKAPAKGKTGLFPSVKKGAGKPIDVKADRTPAKPDAEEGAGDDGAE